MVETIKRIFLDPSRCIGCRSCVAACRECDTHKGESMIYIDYLERHNTVASSPSLCMHCEDPLAPCAQVCPAQAILVSPDGVVQSADETRCIYCENCGYACPFGIPKFNMAGHYMQKCNHIELGEAEGTGIAAVLAIDAARFVCGLHHAIGTDQDGLRRTDLGARGKGVFAMHAEAGR